MDALIIALTYVHWPVWISQSILLSTTPLGSQLQSSQPISGSKPNVCDWHTSQLAPVTRGGHMHRPVVASQRPLGQLHSVTLHKQNTKSFVKLSTAKEFNSKYCSDNKLAWKFGTNWCFKSPIAYQYSCFLDVSTVIEHVYLNCMNLITLTWLFCELMW